ncbi:transporter [Microbispora sp. SCL1-1]|jgi:Kef-type K+ transport system membrane component KefB|uniref:Cation:proton antiporter n=1 Tax=Microbispora hainanensis TaxID=568844 RepID=A0ABZ1SK63_9ACTN|nr:MULTISPECIES: cation:proton antiporter [Microbispora]NJP26626.1 transporter [Microbispora sp. CL1-1]TQS12134.1 transporter [Microbispora sp. SCL1-1]
MPVPALLSVSAPDSPPALAALAEQAQAVDPNLELVLRVLPALAVILLTAAVCGRLANMVLQPRVVGEMVAGVLLGPTLLGAVFPDAQEALFPDEVRPVLYVLSTLGLTLYMFLVGAGIDHDAREPGELRKAGVLAAAGILSPVVLGGAAGLALWDSLSRPDVGRIEFALFLGGALSLTAFPMLARILYERGLQNSRIGRVALLAASIDDAAAWCLLAALSAVHLGGGTGDTLRTIALAALFAVVMLGVVAPLLRPLGRRVARTGSLSAGAVYVIVLVPLTAGWITDAIGVYSVFGGFIAGLSMPRDPAFRAALHGRMMDVVSTLLLPVFFAFSGLNTHLGGIAGSSALLTFALILALAFSGKYFGCSLATRALGFGWRESWAMGAMMNARGLMILIFINIGLAQGMITQELFAMLVLVAVLTTAGAMPLYKLALPERHERAGAATTGSATPVGAAAGETGFN